MSLGTKGFDYRWGAKQKDSDRIIIRVPLWSEWRDLNPRHPAPKAGALPTALHPVIKFPSGWADTPKPLGQKGYSGNGDRNS